MRRRVSLEYHLHKGNFLDVVTRASFPTVRRLCYIDKAKNRTSQHSFHQRPQILIIIWQSSFIMKNIIWLEKLHVCSTSSALCLNPGHTSWPLTYQCTLAVVCFAGASKNFTPISSSLWSDWKKAHQQRHPVRKLLHTVNHIWVAAFGDFYGSLKWNWNDKPSRCRAKMDHVTILIIGILKGPSTLQ